MKSSNHSVRTGLLLPVISLFVVMLTQSGCLLDSRGLWQCDDTYTFVTGNYVHPEGIGRGSVVIEHVEGCLLSGTGYGLTELGIPADAIWGFTGHAQVADAAGGVLHRASVSVTDIGEDVEQRVALELFHMLNADGMETLVLRDTDSLVQVTLNRVSGR